MHIAITGAAGFLGQRLAQQLIQRGELRQQPITQLTLIDQVAAPTPAKGAITVVSQAVDVTQPHALDAVLDQRPEVIYHLAAVVSSAAEADLDLGMQVNFDATRALLEGCRARGMRDTRFIMASSVAAYGGTLPEVLDDMTALHPQNSYGAQKAMCELLINDVSRRGEIDGLVLRLPTIVIRPGRPNAAASSFASSMLREPLNGEEAICPVPTTLEMFVMSPGKVVDALVHGAQVPREALAPFRAFMLPGITVSVADMLAALRKAAGEQALALVKHAPDPRIEAIVASWPARFETAKASQLGFVGDADFTQIIDSFMAEQHA